MKKNITAIVLIIVISLIFMTGSVHALDLSAGGAVWYAWWSPAWTESEEEEMPEFEVDPGILYGPVLSLKFAENWSLSTIFMIGKYEANSEMPLDPETPEMGNFTFDRDITKYDLDTTVNYSITRVLKVFAGIKYQGYNYKDEIHLVMDMSGMPFSPGGVMDIELDGESDYKSYGPGIGLGITYPVIPSLYLLANVSVLYLKGDADATQEVPNFETFDPMTSIVDIEEQTTKVKGSLYGFNGSISLAYYIAEASTTIALGFRYQYLKYKIDSEETSLTYEPSEDMEQEAMFDFDGKKDVFYGVTLSAVYSFDL